MSLTVHTVESLAALEALAPAWEALDRQTEPRLPFSGPRWNLAWWRHFPESQVLVHDRIFAQVVFDGPKLVGVAPMMITERPGRGPVRSRYLQFFGADPNVTEIRGICCRRADEGPVMEAVLAHLEAQASEWDWAFFGGFVENGPAHEALKRRPKVSWGRQVPDFLLQPGPSWEAFKTALPRNVKESIRKCYASLRRDNLKHELKVAQTLAEVEAGLELFFQLHAARAAAPSTPPHLDVFERAASRAFLEDYVRGSAEAGEARVFVLEVEGKPVAARVGFLLGDQLYLYFSGYEPAMADYSVMTTCVAEALQWAIRAGVKTVNLSPGRDQSKTRWRPVEVPLLEAQVVSPSLRAPTVHRIFTSLDARIRRAAFAPGPLGEVVRLARRRR